MGAAFKFSTGQIATPPLWIRNPPTPPVWDPSVEFPRVWFEMNHTTGSGLSLVLVDQSTNGRDATVGSSSAPAIVPNVLNGNPVLRLDGNLGHYMRFGGTTPLMPTNAQSTVVIVYKAPSIYPVNTFATMLSLCTKTTAGGGFEGFLSINAAGYTNLFFGGGNGGGNVNYCGVAGFDYYSAFVGLVTSYTGAGDFSVPGSFACLSNNVAQTIVNTGQSGTAGAESMIGAWPAAGPGLFFTGDIAEIIVFPSLPTAYAADLHNYLNTKYGPGVG